MFKLHSIPMLLLSLLLFSCNTDPVDPVVVLPTNLQTTVTTNEGVVDITATAENANFFTFTFYEGTDSTTIEAADGIATYTYSDSGSHRVRTRAHATYPDFIELNETVEVVIVTPVVGGLPTTGFTSPMSYPGYTLVWNDEFDGNTLGSHWVHEIGTGSWGWGNNELQYYRAENTEVKDGMLIITAKEENFGGQNYTSSRIITQGHQSFKYGRIDIRAALPYGKGIWPALWMLGDNFSTQGWPSCGEIDIMEMIGGNGYNDRTTHGTIHWSDNGSHASFGGNKSLSSGKLADEWHVFSIIWDATSIKWLLDDVQFHVADTSPSELSEFQENFFFIFNVAVGGNWPGSPDGSTLFPQKMAVDYVRVFQ